MNYSIVAFVKGDHKLPFKNSEEKIEKYFKEILNREVERKTTQGYVLKIDEEIAGYYTLSSSLLVASDLPENELKQLGRRPEIPVILLGMMGVSAPFTGKGLGELLLVDALRTCQGISSKLGVFAVVLDPLTESSKKFFSKYGFEELRGGKMFLTVKSIPVE